MFRQAGPATTGGRGAAEIYLAEDVVLQTARTLARELGLAPIAPSTGAALRLFAAMVNARAVIEIGTGTGVSGLWLLRGMRADGVLTTIDTDAEHQRFARRVFVEAGFVASRSRVIAGRALDVLPRLTDGGYDMMVVDGDPAEHEAAVAGAARLLRPGGVVAVVGCTIELADAVRDSSDVWLPALLPTPDGLLAAVRR
ncbi:MAG: methyltransferase domain-containing protein [Hamadaea sp.]|nr:methyltransferase domain-containing protein [Hamadaea sp.]